MYDFIKDNEFQCHAKDGRSVDLKHNRLSYRKGDHFMTIESMLLGNRVVVRRGSIRNWHPPHDQERITAAKKSEILKDVTAAMSVLGAEVEWID